MARKRAQPLPTKDGVGSCPETPRQPESNIFAFIHSALPLFRFSDLPDEWGSITVDHKRLLDGGSIWSLTFDDYSLVAGAGGAPLVAVSHDEITRGVVSVERIANAASPAVHRVLVAALSTLESTGMFALSLEGVVTRAISVDVSADDLQDVSTLSFKLSRLAGTFESRGVSVHHQSLLNFGDRLLLRVRQLFGRTATFCCSLVLNISTLDLV